MSNNAIATIAANVAAAMATVTTATDAASVVKFNAIADFVAGVAMRLRVEHINTGSNLETDKKGRIIALVDSSKEQRAALVAAFQAAGIGEKDAANIATMGRTASLHFVNHMVSTGSIRIAKSGDEMREFIVESFKQATGGLDTYNSLEKARARKWEAPAAEVEEEATDDTPAITLPAMDETLDDAPVIHDEPAPTPQEVLNNECGQSIKALASALERGDVENLLSLGFRQLLSEGLAKVTAFEQEQAAAKVAEEAEALRAQADKVEAKAKKTA